MTFMVGRRDAQSRGRLIAVAYSLIVMFAFADRSFGAEIAIDAPNMVVISPRLVTAGQPTAASLSRLREQGIEAVIYLAPPTVADAVPAEAEIVRKQGLEFVNIPINFGNPTEADFEEFVAVMRKLRDRKVLVHCQVNMRASTMTFLYRVIIDQVKPDSAYVSVAQVWSPQGPWKALIVKQLQKAAIEFDPY